MSKVELAQSEAKEIPINELIERASKFKSMVLYKNIKGTIAYPTIIRFLKSNGKNYHSKTREAVQEVVLRLESNAKRS